MYAATAAGSNRTERPTFTYSIRHSATRRRTKRRLVHSLAATSSLALLAPLHRFGDAAQEPVFQRREVGIVVVDEFPREGRRPGPGCGVGAGLVLVDLVSLDGEPDEHADPVPAVGAVVLEGLAGPVAGDEDAAPADAEGGPLVDPALAVAG